MATLYTGRTGGTTKSNPFTTTAAEAAFFVDPGVYRVDFSDTQLPIRKADYSVYFDAISGANQGIEFAQLPTANEGKHYEVGSSGVVTAEYALGDNGIGQFPLVQKTVYVQTDVFTGGLDESIPYFIAAQDTEASAGSLVGYALDGNTEAAEYFYWEPSMYTRNNRTTRWRLVGSVLCNNVNPTPASYVNMGVRAISDSADTADQISLTYPATSFIEVAVDLGQGTQDSSNTTIDAPGSAGYYGLNLWTGDAQPAGGHAGMFNLSLYVYWVIP